MKDSLWSHTPVRGTQKVLQLMLHQLITMVKIISFIWSTNRDWETLNFLLHTRHSPIGAERQSHEWSWHPSFWWADNFENIMQTVHIRCDICSVAESITLSMCRASSELSRLGNYVQETQNLIYWCHCGKVKMWNDRKSILVKVHAQHYVES